MRSRLVGVGCLAALAALSAMGCDGGGMVSVDAGSIPDGGGRDGGGRDGGGRDGGGGDAAIDGGGDGGGADAGVCGDGRMLCTTAGTSCDGDTVVTCALDADGCLVPTRTDCTATSEVCQVMGGVAACADRCAYVPPAERCTTEGRDCSSDTLVVCAMDAMGCLVQTSTDCTATPGGVCDTTGTMPVCRSPSDPCAGHTSCGTSASRSCADATHLAVCDADALGCFVDMGVDCGAMGMVCDDASGTASCIDPCSRVTTCPSATYCDGNAAVTCAPDAAGCLVETTRSTCTMGTCSGGTCGDACPAATPRTLDCTSGTVMGDTSTGTTLLSTYNCHSGLSYPGHEVAYRFSNPRAARVRIVSTRISSTGDYDLYALDAGDGTSIACDSATSCLASSTGTSATETVTFDVRAGQQAYVVYDLYGSTGTDTSTYSLAITCVEPTCGDGLVEAFETCDDHNTMGGDGCSATCTLETGYVCYGAPSVCGTALTCGNGVTETGETCDDANGNDGDGCSSACAIEAGYGCTGTPSVCVPLCGNGVLDTGETCDDRNAVAGDGCTACAIDAGWNCTGAPSVCTMQAPNATCAAGTAITATTTLTGEDTRNGGASPTGTTCGSAGSATLYYSVTIPAFTRVRVDVTPTGFDPVIKTEDACGAAACSARIDAGGSGTAETTSLTNSTTTPVTRVVAVNGYSGAGGVYSIAFTYTVAACGNGVVDAGETCDDMNVADGDGCSSACAIESGYTCSGAPSACILLAPNASCAGAIDLGSSGTSMGDLRAGGARPTGTGCTSASGPALWYAVTIPANSSTTIVATPTGTPSWDPVISVNTSCAATGCAQTRDAGGSGAAETLSITNTSGAAITRVFAVGSYSATTYGTVTVTVSSAPLPYMAIPASCVDMSGATTLTLGTGTSDDGATAVLPLPFSFTFQGAAQMSYSVTTNGFMQLYPAATGTPSTSLSNADIPASGTPNNFIAPFWDDLTNMTLRSQTFGTAGSQVLVVEWSGRVYADASSTVRFQAMIYEGVPNLELHYCQMSTTGTSTAVTGSSATVGIENAGGTAGTRVSYNTAGAVTTGSGFRLVP